MKAGCGISLATFALTGAAYYAWLRGRFDPPGDWIAALVGGFLMMMVAGLLQNAHLAWRDQRVMDRAHQGMPPEDGKTFAASGPIRPLGRPLLAPFSGTECVAYEYDVVRGAGSEGDGGGNAYGGFHLTPSAVETSIGRVKLLSWPVLDDFRRRRVEDEQGQARAAAYVAATTFEPMGVTKVYAQLKELLTDDDGFVRKDWRMGEGPVDVAACGLRERLVPVGEVVSAIGPYSAEKNGIVPGVGRGQAPVRLLRGSAATVYAKLRGRSRNHFTGAVIMAIVVNAAILLLAARYEAYMEPQRRINRAEALAQAARQGNVAALRRLLPEGSDPDLRREDDTPLMIAAQQGHVEAVRALIAAGADLEIVNPRWGRTALEQALDAEQYDTARVLREAGARDVTVSTRNGSALPPDGGEPYRACAAWLAAVQREDVPALKVLWAGDHRNLDGIDFSVWKGARPPAPWFLQGFANESAATLYVGGGDREAPATFWGYQLVRQGGTWKIARENWLQRGVPPVP
jgi:hypothetical protein